MRLKLCCISLVKMVIIKEIGKLPFLSNHLVVHQYYQLKEKFNIIP